MKHDVAEADHGFPRTARLTQPAQYRRVFAGATRVADRLFTILVRRNDGSHARLGLAVPRRAVASAVARNRVKRLVREHFRQRRADLPAVDCVVIAKPPVRTAGRARLHHSLQRLWDRVHETCAVS